MVESVTKSAGGSAIAVGIATAAAGVLVAELSKRVANAVIGSPNDEEDRKYEMMHERISQHNFYIPPSEGEQPRAAPKRQSRSAKRTPVMEHVKGAIQNLEEAKQSTNCGACLKGLDKAIDAVKTESAVVMRADRKYEILQDLKNAGKIPVGATWHSLNPKQKNFINRQVEKEIKHDE